VSLEKKEKGLIMKQRFVLLVAVFAFGTSLLMAQFWKNRSFTEWNDTQVERILENSPWAQSTAVTVRAASEGGSSGDMGILAFGFQRGGGGGGISTPDMPTPTMVVVRWESALPVRQALARMHFGSEAGTSQESLEYLGRTPSSYVLRIVGIPGGGGLGSPESLAAGARLTPRNQEPIQAIQAQLERAGRGVDLFLVFSKQPPDGHTFTVDDRNVQVEVDTETIELRRRFNLNDMVYEGNLEM